MVIQLEKVLKHHILLLEESRYVSNRIIKKINFNDSCVNWLHHEIDTVILNVDLCMWKQKGYQEGEPELKQKFLKFLDVKNYNWDSEKKKMKLIMIQL